MATGYALLIGLNGVDKNQYAGWDGALNVCENDAVVMEAFAKSKKINNIKKLLGKQATREAVLEELNKAATTLKEGDLFLLYYSGHGGNEIPDLNGDEFEKGNAWKDKFDESWCLYNGQLIDDELFFQWKLFKKGVRIVVISDSCFSGDIVKIFSGSEPRKSKAMDKEAGEKTYDNNKNFYKKIAKDLAVKEAALPLAKQGKKIAATLLQFSSSQEGQPSVPESQFFPNNSLFTGLLLQQMGKEKFKSYDQLISVMKRTMPDFQTPKEQVLGDEKIKILFEAPFKI